MRRGTLLSECGLQRSPQKYVPTQAIQNYSCFMVRSEDCSRSSWGTTERKSRAVVLCPSAFKQKACIAPFFASVLRIGTIQSSEQVTTQQDEVAKCPRHAYAPSSVAQIFTVFQRGRLRKEDEATPYNVRVILP